VASTPSVNDSTVPSLLVNCLVEDVDKVTTRWQILITWLCAPLQHRNTTRRPLLSRLEPDELRGFQLPRSRIVGDNTFARISLAHR